LFIYHDDTTSKNFIRAITPVSEIGHFYIMFTSSSDSENNIGFSDRINFEVVNPVASVVEGAEIPIEIVFNHMNDMSDTPTNVIQSYDELNSLFTLSPPYLTLDFYLIDFDTRIETTDLIWVENA
jgi:hypothetical protein